jgi:apolipoprotein N-acyltransferase
MGVLLYGFGFMFFLICVFISSYWITYYQGTSMYQFYIFGGLITLILGVASGYLLVKYLINNRKFKRKFNNEYVEQTPNLVVEFVKAKYNKYCPKITWK